MDESRVQRREASIHPQQKKNVDFSAQQIFIFNKFSVVCNTKAVLTFAFKYEMSDKPLFDAKLIPP